jgi:hypothetical protein
MTLRKGEAIARFEAGQRQAMPWLWGAHTA